MIYLFITVLALIIPNNADSYNIKSWAIQLQKYNKKQLTSVDVDLLVLDIDELIDSKIKLKDIRNNKKYIISYLSIGEAENYRWYWKHYWNTHKPIWLDKENPEWKGNYKVKYWYNSWQRIILRSIDRIIANGFDGVYLDIIDAYEYYEHHGKKDALELMIQFVRRIAKYARKKKHNFLIIPQNVPQLLLFDEYLEVIDGIAKEDTWYDGDNIQTKEEIQRILHYLDRAKAAGKFVLILDYPSEYHKICDFFLKAHSRGYIPFVSNRALNKINIYKCKKE